MKRQIWLRLQWLWLHMTRVRLYAEVFVERLWILIQLLGVQIQMLRLDIMIRVHEWVKGGEYGRMGHQLWIKKHGRKKGRKKVAS